MHFKYIFKWKKKSGGILYVELSLLENKEGSESLYEFTCTDTEQLRTGSSEFLEAWGQTRG